MAASEAQATRDVQLGAAFLHLKQQKKKRRKNLKDILRRLKSLGETAASEKGCLTFYHLAVFLLKLYPTSLLLPPTPCD